MADDGKVGDDELGKHIRLRFRKWFKRDEISL
jgi:hypothetical protein